MRRTKGRLKLTLVLAFAIAGLAMFAGNDKIAEHAIAFSDGPPAGFTGAPGEETCANCHFGPTTGGTFTVMQAPANYVPGQSYQIVVRHENADVSLHRWGFQLTALAGTSMAGSFANLGGGLTQIVGGQGGRDYIEHTSAGTFNNQTGSAQWTFNWTAPATNVGPVTFYAAGNQANGDGMAGGDRIITATAASQPPSTVESPFDFDGDHKTDIGIYRPGPSEWWINRSGNPSQTLALQFGVNGDVVVSGDYTGDGKADVANWHPANGFWYILRSEDFSFFAFPFGAQGDIPVPADFDGDNKSDPAVFRPSTTLWFISQSTTGGTQIVQFGLPIDKPVPADYDGDGKADVAVRRPTGGNSEWWVNRSTAGSLALVFGADTDLGVPGDYTGDGKADIAFWRPSTGFWFVLRSEDFSFFAVPFGTTGDVPVPGDYDGDGKFDRAVFRPTDTNWFIDRTTAGVQIVQFGSAGDLPIPNSVVR
ncbi:MAG: hypothetical protein DMF63_16230 [Acidobacteria bacterium]|nr:MAG: hypothetical protein DMF63_16230 [Acidobacteriota bacterium]